MGGAAGATRINPPTITEICITFDAGCELPRLLSVLLKGFAPLWQLSDDENSPLLFSAQQQMITRIQVVPSSLHTVRLLWHSGFKAVS